MPAGAGDKNDVHAETQRRRDAEKKEQALDTVLKARVEEALADPQPSIPQADLFADLRARHEAHNKT